MKWSETVAFGFMWAAPVLFGFFVHAEMGFLLGLFMIFPSLVLFMKYL